MHKVLLIIFAFLTNWSFSQEYNLPFADSNTAWVTHEHGGGMPSEYWEKNYRNYVTNRDTIFQDTSYHILFKGEAPPTNFSQQPYISGYYRIDSLKVFHREFLQTFSKEKLIYDFGIEVGDTFQLEYSCPYYLDSIDSINIAGYYYRKFNFSSLECWGFNETYWIEGIGSNTGFYPFKNEGEHFATLRCYWANNHGISIDYYLDVHTCFGLGIEEESSSILKFFPNPSSDFITIEGDFAQYDFILRDNLGHEILEQKASSKLDLSALESGIYFLFISDKGEIKQIEKIVKL